jgi:peptidyl-dipeptidase Dcp
LQRSCCSKIKATEAGHEGQYLIGLQNTTQQPILQNLSNRTTREKYSKRLGLGSKNDGDTEVLEQMARLWFAKANLMEKEFWKL